MHVLLLNQLPQADASRSLAVRALDVRGRATLAGAEVRVSAGGTTRLLATRLIDSGPATTRRTTSRRMSAWPSRAPSTSC
jgi:hypothetical protein